MTICSFWYLKCYIHSTTFIFRRMDWNRSLHCTLCWVISAYKACIMVPEQLQQRLHSHYGQQVIVIGVDCVRYLGVVMAIELLEMC